MSTDTKHKPAICQRCKAPFFASDDTPRFCTKCMLKCATPDCEETIDGEDGAAFLGYCYRCKKVTEERASRVLGTPKRSAGKKRKPETSPTTAFPPPPKKQDAGKREPELDHGPETPSEDELTPAQYNARVNHIHEHMTQLLEVVSETMFEKVTLSKDYFLDAKKDDAITVARVAKHIKVVHEAFETESRRLLSAKENLRVRNRVAAFERARRAQNAPLNVLSEVVADCQKSHQNAVTITRVAATAASV